MPYFIVLIKHQKNTGLRIRSFVCLFVCLFFRISKIFIRPVDFGITFKQNIGVGLLIVVWGQHVQGRKILCLRESGWIWIGVFY